MDHPKIINKGTILVFFLIILLLLLIFPFSFGLNNSFDTTLEKHVQKKAEIGKPVEWVLQTGNYTIEYETPAPIKIEKELSGKKRIEIISNASVYYYNVTAYTTLPELDYKPKIYRIVNNNRIDITNDPIYNVTYLDTNSNGKYDKIQWIVPQLFNDTYEVDLTILNVQSYPQVGGNWTVKFTTQGTANLTIKAVSGTTWSNSNEDNDLKFLKLKCGSEEVNYDWVDNSVFVANWNCNDTSYEISKVITSGKHTLEFKFGNDIEYAHNLAGSVCGVMFSNISYVFKDSSGNEILTIDSNGNLYIAAASFTNGTTPSVVSNGINLYGAGLKWVFNHTVAEITGNVIDETTVPSSAGNNDILFRNSSNDAALVFFNGSSGNILARGIAVYDGAVAECDMVNSIDKGDIGDQKDVAGCVFDYDFCNISNGKSYCHYSIIDERCNGNDAVYELFASGTSYSNTSRSCGQGKGCTTTTVLDCASHHEAYCSNFCDTDNDGYCNSTYDLPADCDDTDCASANPGVTDFITTELDASCEGAYIAGEGRWDADCSGEISYEYLSEDISDITDDCADAGWTSYTCSKLGELACNLTQEPAGDGEWIATIRDDCADFCFDCGDYCRVVVNVSDCCYWLTSCVKPVVMGFMRVQGCK
ncbi:MAG: hypothetical protein ACTSYQ_01910 [Candidatus Odinarchaeia archaeon]